MNDDNLPRPPAPAPGRPFAAGRSGNPAGRPRGARNQATLAAETLLAGEAEGLTRKAVELALAGDPLALRLCLERLLPRCREPAISFRLPRLAAVRKDGAPGPAPREIFRMMRAVTAAVAHGEVTPGEGARFAGMLERFVRAIATAKKENINIGLLRILTADRGDESDPADDLDGADDDEFDDGPDADDYDA